LYTPGHSIFYHKFEKINIESVAGSRARSKGGEELNLSSVVSCVFSPEGL
jgi:hypothetical protein